MATSRSSSTIDGVEVLLFTIADCVLLRGEVGR